MAAALQQNGKQPPTRTGTTVSTLWKRGFRPPKKKMERKGSSESELVAYDWTALNQWRTQNFFFGGVQQIQLRTEDKEDGDLGVVAP